MSIPISAVIPTRNRVKTFARMLASLEGQDRVPAEMIVIDGSSDDATKTLLDEHAKALDALGCKVVYQRAVKLGAATQRNQGIAVAREPVIAFFDDDIIFEEDCIERLWSALQTDSGLGGVNAMITN